MRLLPTSVIIGFLPFFLQTGQCAKCTNITISNADDAAQVRENCKTIKGWLTFDKDLNETINLNGVETIDGDLVYESEDWEGEGEVDEPYPTGRTPFNIHSSTLKTIKGELAFGRFIGLAELRFPNLTRIENSLYLYRMHYLKLLDITKLTHLGSLTLEAKHLTTLRHETFKGFTGTALYGGGLQFWSAKVKSLDSWFNYPLKRYHVSEFGITERAPASVDLSTYNLPNLKNITIGWAKTDIVRIAGDGVSVKFGASQTTSMEIDLVVLRGNVTVLERGPNLKELKVGGIIAKSNFGEELDLSAFDKVSNLTIDGNNGLQKIRLSPKAVDWEDMNLDIRHNVNLTLTSEYRDSENKTDKYWYWPEGDILSISIRGTPFADDFFTSFLQDRNSSNASKVLDHFGISPFWAEEENATDFDCTPFDALHNRSVLPKDYSCGSYKSSASSTQVYWSFVTIALLTSVIRFL
ncbi:hypothetical protein B0T10DRAFT_492149 [Thelonectria olida]|uniref:Uncharacterized protein n=1 Tax=Thelonectria olida TaxID=1576542 RepID=A0A9P9APU0_9HYPO|nr:hypothetical protein B0T10DRAFT_492149 [Thelonectria olida]